jgi:protein-disulfide isomerase
MLKKSAQKINRKITLPTLTKPTRKNMFQAKKINEYIKTAFKLLRKASNTQVLVFLLVIAAFLVGVLVTKISFLEKELATYKAPSQQQDQQQPPVVVKPLGIAKTIGLDAKKFKSCVESGKYAKQATQDTNDGQNANVSGTPTTFINGQIVVGAVPYSELQTIIDQEIQNPNAPLPSGTRAEVSNGSFPAIGKADAPITIIEFADFQCPFCEKYFTDIQKQLIKDYVDTGKAKFYFRNFAFLGADSNALAEASFCANEQGKFWAYNNFIYSHQGQENSGWASKNNLVN